eukprot:8820448-Pyramimonas_sp.AAC.1
MQPFLSWYAEGVLRDGMRELDGLQAADARQPLLLCKRLGGRRLHEQQLLLLRQCLALSVRETPNELAFVA